MKIESMVTITGAEYEALRAEVERLREELDTWKSVFPDIAPASVLPDRSLLEAEVERLRAALEEINMKTRCIKAVEIARAALNLSQEPRT
jgi:CCR4-NOT transcriptional regulation complex NOT5 subunit